MHGYSATNFAKSQREVINCVKLFLPALLNRAVSCSLLHMDEREKFLKEVEAFLKLHGMRKTVFSKLAGQRYQFVDRLRAGGGVLMPTLDEVRAFMRDYRPNQPAPKKKSRGEARAA